MQSTSSTDFRLATPLVYVETTIPPGMTIAEYRASRPRSGRRRRWWQRLAHA